MTVSRRRNGLPPFTRASVRSERKTIGQDLNSGRRFHYAHILNTIRHSVIENLSLFGMLNRKGNKRTSHPYFISSTFNFFFFSIVGPLTTVRISASSVLNIGCVKFRNKTLWSEFTFTSIATYNFFFLRLVVVVVVVPPPMIIIMH